MFKSQKTVFYKLSNLTKENGPHMLTGVHQPKKHVHPFKPPLHCIKYSVSLQVWTNGA